MIDKIVSFIVSILTAILSIGYTPTPVTNVNPDSPVEFKSAQSVTVMTYNVYFSGDDEKSPENRAPLIAQNIREFNPDSVGIEECTSEWRKLLGNALPEYTLIGTPRALIFGEASPILYKTEKYDLIDSGTFWLSRTPSISSRGWDASINRVCTYAVLRDKITGFTYAHFNAHFDHKGIISRKEAVAVVTEKVKELCPNIPVVFSGDLNENEESEMYARVLESGFSDTRYSASEVINGYCSTFHGYKDYGGYPIDFIFANSAFIKSVDFYQVDLTEYNGIFPSDHHPVIAGLTLYN